MKPKRLFIALASVLVFVVVAGLIVRLREPNLLEEVSRFARLGPEGEVSKAEVQKILQENTPGPIVITATQNDTSAPLESIPVIQPKQSKPDPDLNELRPLPKRGGSAVNLPGKFKDPVLQESLSFAPELNISTPLQNFDGLNNVNGVLPPDTNGDVGPNHYMEWVNLSFAIYNKSGALIYGPAAGNTLWSGFGGPCQTTNNGDPIVQYDHLADRWMVSQFSLPNYPSGPFYQCIAISQTGNPTGAWYRYAFQISNTKLNDYPHFGVWPDGYYMSVNQFVGNTWGGAGVVAFEREKMLLGQPAQAVYFDLYSVDPNLGGLLPSDLDGPTPATGTPNYFLQVDDNGFGYPQDQLEVWQFSVNWTNPAASTFTQTALLPTAAFDSDMCAGSRNCIPQPGTTVKLDPIADRLMYRLQYRNFGDHQTLVLNHTVDVNNTDRAGIRWYELRNAGSGWSIFQQGTFSPDATQRWMGSMAMDGKGNIAVGYSASSSTTYPAIRYTGRLAGDPLGQLPQGEGTLINGTGAQTHSASRWGDYSSLSLDPVDDCTFWYANEYIQTTGSSSWRTRIGSFQLPGCGNAGPTPTATLTRTPTAINTPTFTATASVPGTLTFAAGADTRVSQASPTTNYGTATTVLVDGDSGAAQTGYIRFTTSGISGSIQSVKLRVYCATNGTANGPSAYLADSNWIESGTGGVTWNTQPTLLSGAFDNKGAIAADSWIEYDVTALVTGNGTYTFALVADSSDGITFSSREGVASPQLVVTPGTGAPSPTATFTRTSTPTSTPGSSPTNTPTLTATAGAPGTLTFTTAADTRVSQASPTTNYGTASTLLVDGDSGAAQTGYIRFTTSGISGSIQSVKLRVYCTTNGTANGPSAYLADSNWLESGTGGMTWNTQPTLLSGAFDNKGTIATDSWVEYDVTALVTGNATYTFALVADSADGVTFSSREGTAAPQLIVTLGVGAPTPTNTPLAASANTGFLIASANAAQTGGDGNGYETNPVNAYLNDSLFTVDTNSGTDTSSSCTGTTKDKHRYYNYGMNIPGSTILGIEVRLDAKADSTSGSPKLCIQLSWNGGSNWTTAKQTTTLTTAEQSYILGSPSDTWGHAWTLSQLSNANFRVRIIDVATSTSRDFSLDWITVRITYH
ncbi:MAG TPA: DNRLRE domain-containing protein [Anaerolineales bacterium]